MKHTKFLDSVPENVPKLGSQFCLVRLKIRTISHREQTVCNQALHSLRAHSHTPIAIAKAASLLLSLSLFPLSDSDSDDSMGIAKKWVQNPFKI